MRVVKPHGDVARLLHEMLSVNWNWDSKNYFVVFTPGIRFSSLTTVQLCHVKVAKIWRCFFDLKFLVIIDEEAHIRIK